MNNAVYRQGDGGQTQENGSQPSIAPPAGECSGPDAWPDTWPGLRIGGFHPASFNDFPGRVAAVVFTRGCNFRCPWCHNPQLISSAHRAPHLAAIGPAHVLKHASPSRLPQSAAPGERWTGGKLEKLGVEKLGPDTDFSPEEILARLAARRGKIGGVVISGGEPALQPDLLPFCRALKKLGLAVKVDSNGSRPEVLQQLLAAGAVDYLAMDIKAPLARYPELAGVEVDLNAIGRSISLLAASGIGHHFRTTQVSPALAPADLDEIRRLVPPGSPHKTQPFRPLQQSSLPK